MGRPRPRGRPVRTVRTADLGIVACWSVKCLNRHSWRPPVDELLLLYLPPRPMRSIAGEPTAPPDDGSELQSRPKTTPFATAIWNEFVNRICQQIVRCSAPYPLYA